VDSRRQGIFPFTEYTLHIFWYAFHDNRCERDERSVFHTCGENAVFLCENERILKGVVSGLSRISDDDVDFEEGI
jgi:hypothetical protein